MSGRTHGPAPILTAAQASQLLDVVVLERVRELVDLEGLLNFEQELWLALIDCGLPRQEAPAISATMIAQAFTRIGEDHLRLATDDDSAPARDIREATG